MKRADLVVARIRKYDGRCRQFAFNNFDARRVNAGKQEVRTVRAEVGACRRDYLWRLTEERKVVGDVSGRTAKFHGKFVHEKTQVDAVYLVRHNVLGEQAPVIHDAVKRDRTGYDYFSSKIFFGHIMRWDMHV